MLVIGIDPGENTAFAVLDDDLQVIETCFIKPWNISTIHHEFLSLALEYMNDGYKVFVAIEVSDKVLFGAGGIKRGIDVGQLIGRMNDLHDLIEASGFLITKVKPRSNKYLKMNDRQTREMFKIDHKTNEHERDAIGIARVGLNSLKFIELNKLGDQNDRKT